APAASAATVKLSDETSLSRWAHPVDRSWITRAPRTGAHRIARLRLDTEDALPNVYLVLRRTTDQAGRRWFQVRIPMRPNGRKGWVRDRSLGRLHTVRTRLVVNRRTLHAVLWRNGRRVFRAAVGVGKPGTPTPRGRFWIRERLTVRGHGGLYGPLAFGTAAYASISDWPRGGVVGIHGTNEPGLIPGRPSHGCIRMRNDDILRLGRLMPIGTPLRIY
ncbi:MAG: hypothetical protein QOJ22_1287, partial [Thermoleophilaceae bacterium]|nr:hypothetical protein [Thermoleophilaceae bacterium]